MFTVKHLSSNNRHEDIINTYDDIEDAMEDIKQSVGYELAKMHGHYTKTIIEWDGDKIFEANY